MSLVSKKSTPLSFEKSHTKFCKALSIRKHTVIKVASSHLFLSYVRREIETVVTVFR